MENLYKLTEYSDKLPNPVLFPMELNVIAVKGHPRTFSNGFILEVLVRYSDVERLEKGVERTIDEIYFQQLLEDSDSRLLLLSEPEFIYDITYPTYIVFTPEGNPVGIQVKYYNYFRNNYPECNFYGKDEGSSHHSLLAIRVLKEVVGLCMPISLGNKTLEQIKEERK